VSVVQPLPRHPNLTNLRKQAKTLLTAWRAGDQQALTRVCELHPRGERLLTDGQSSLADAQLVVARGYGFTSWTRLVQHLRLAARAQALHTMDLLFRATLAPGGEPSTVGQVLDRRVDLVWQAHLDGNPAAGVLLAAAGGGRRFDATAGAELTVDDVRAVIAREHGFTDWAAVTGHRDRPVDRHFEAAVDAIVSGDLNTLPALLDRHPMLVQARSGSGTTPPWSTTLPRTVSRQAGNGSHRATPSISCGSCCGAAATRTRCVRRTADQPRWVCWPRRHIRPTPGCRPAGLVEELCRAGANPNGLDEDGTPLWTAITFGYPAAVDALARCGARVDNIVFAAAVDDLAGVTEYLRGDRRLTAEQPRSVQRIGVRGPLLDPNHMIEYALIYSAGPGRRAIVQFLLACNPDLSVTEPRFHSTAAGMARYHHRPDILALLERLGCR
jgi:hypothetical protein